MLSISPCHMSATIAALAGVFGVHQDHGHACELCLVLDKAPELGKRPSCHAGTLRRPKPSLTADILQVFQGYPTISAFGRRNERLADTVIHIPAKAGLFSSHPPEGTADTLGPFAVHLRNRCRALQPLSALRIPRAARFNPSTAMGGAVRGRRQVDDAKVDAQDVLRIKRRVFGHVDGTEEIEHAIAQHQIGLPLDASLSGLLVGATDKRHAYPSPKSPEARTVEPLEAQDALVVAQSAVGLERRTDRLVTLKTLHRLRNGAYRQLRRQPKALAYLMVGKMVDGDLPEHAIGKASRRGVGCCFVIETHRIT